ncbi:hypothetical protein [Hymenobacter armeniacus]|uniref:Uncharacterized protein n=1 Tax=Hymenobacter armeniacus TaxID=2771358 RepID=A0ABR8JVI8_9BACT|nr:hypothetical protein [Hymenobacter armeniacus]MBD2723982.1 hypothetical protein [Hymenobacter armeniacus]
MAGKKGQKRAGAGCRAGAARYQLSMLRKPIHISAKNLRWPKISAAASPEKVTCVLSLHSTGLAGLFLPGGARALPLFSPAFVYEYLDSGK